MTSRTRHVWVTRQHHAASSDPGLVLEWRQAEGGWEALVTYLQRQTLDQQAVTEWLPADQLVPVPWRPGMGTAYG